MTSMVSRSTLDLRDAILAEAHRRGVPLAEESLKLSQGLPRLCLRLGDHVLQGAKVWLPGSSRDLPDVITVHGSGYRSSRMWPRKRDGSFNIGAVVDHLLALVRQEVERPQPDLSFLAKNAPAASSGLHVIHVGAVLLGALPAGSSVEDLVARVGDEARRAAITAHCERGGLSDSDLRALGDAAGIFFGRATKLGDVDPFELHSDRSRKVLRLGRRIRRSVEPRFVLLLHRRGDEITIADPAGEGIVTVKRRTLETEWRLGAEEGKPWLGSVMRRKRASGTVDPAEPPAGS